MPADNGPPLDPALLGEWVRARLRKAAPSAVNAITELAENADSEQVRLQAAKDLLGLVGVTQKQQIEVDHGIKASKEEVDFELQNALKKIQEGRKMKALPAAPEEDLIVEAIPEEEFAVVENPPEESPS